jgi:hypothetical protein
MAISSWSADGAPHHAGAGDPRLDRNLTTSLPVRRGLFARVALASLARTLVYAIFAATDGYGNAQAEPDWKARWAADLVGLGRAYGAGWIGEQLNEWVAACASSAGSGDDTTAALALNPAATAARPAPAAWLPPAGQPTLAGQPTIAASPSRWQADSAPDHLTIHGDMTLPIDPRHPEPAGSSGGRFASSLLLPAMRTRWWLVGALALAIAVAVYVLLIAPAPGPAHPKTSPTPVRTASPSLSPTHSRTHSPTPSSAPTRTAQPSSTRTAGQKTTSPAVSPTSGRPTSRAATK